MIVDSQKEVRALNGMQRMFDNVPSGRGVMSGTRGIRVRALGAPAKTRDLWPPETLSLNNGLFKNTSVYNWEFLTEMIGKLEANLYAS